MIYPKFPKEGDTIGICAPSAGVGDKIEFFDLSMETLRSRGFQLEETDSVRNESYPSASAEERGSEFNYCFGNERISAVLCASGGDYCIEMLPFIDQNLVKSNPKWFTGYSDPTSIEMLLTTKLDIATIYGVNAGAWDWRPLHESQEISLRILKGDLPVQHSYDKYFKPNFEVEPSVYNMDTDVKWELFMPEHVSDTAVACCSYAPAYELEVSGRLIGGCIDVIDWIMGTPYEDLEGFCARYKDDGFIWFFDNFDLDPLKLQYVLRKMQLKGLFKDARAIIFGRTFLPGEATDADYLEKINRVLADTGVPLIWNADIGHTKPSMTLINGAIGHFSFHHGHATLSMELK